MTVAILFSSLWALIWCKSTCSRSNLWIISMTFMCMFLLAQLQWLIMKANEYDQFTRFCHCFCFSLAITLVGSPLNQLNEVLVWVTIHSTNCSKLLLNVRWGLVEGFKLGMSLDRIWIRISEPESYPNLKIMFILFIISVFDPNSSNPYLICIWPNWIK